MPESNTYRNVAIDDPEVIAQHHEQKRKQIAETPEGMREAVRSAVAASHMNRMTVPTSNEQTTINSNEDES